MQEQGNFFAVFKIQYHTLSFDKMYHFVVYKFIHKKKHGYLRRITGKENLVSA